MKSDYSILSTTYNVPIYVCVYYHGNMVPLPTVTYVPLGRQKGTFLMLPNYKLLELILATAGHLASTNITVSHFIAGHGGPSDIWHLWVEIRPVTSSDST